MNLIPFDRADWNLFGGAESTVQGGVEEPPLIAYTGERNGRSRAVIADLNGLSIIDLNPEDASPSQVIFRCSYNNAIFLGESLTEDVVFAFELERV